MFANYLKISLVLLLKNRLYSSINILGYSVGLAACILIGLYVRHEFSYDRYHHDAERIYRITRDYYPGNGTPDMLLATNAAPVAPLLADIYPQVEEATRIFQGFNVLVRYEETSAFENLLRFADSNLFKFFRFDWKQGNPATALAAPNSVVLTESMALRYFGNSNPMGKVLQLQYDIVLEVTGIIRDLPDNTHLRADGFASLTTLSSRGGADFENNWSSNNFYTYVKLQEGTDQELLADNFPDLLDQHYQENASSFTNMRIQPLTDIHLHSSALQLPMKPIGDLNTVLTFLAVAICLLLIASFNFMNLSVARSAQRSKEVGMRLAVGAGRAQVILQFLLESVMAALLALALGMVLVELVLPLFNGLLGLQLSSVFTVGPGFLLSLVGVTMVAGLLAGVYPALYLSSFNTARVLSGAAGSSRAGQFIRGLLVVLQFSAAIVLVVATAVIYLQLNFSKTAEPGFNKDNVLILDNLGERWPVLKERLSDHPGVLGITASNLAPSENNANALMARYEGGPSSSRAMQFLLVDYDFFSTYDIDLLAGRNFSPEYPSDRLVLPSAEDPNTSAGFILSRMAVEQLGWTPERALGRWFEMGLENDFSRSFRGPVIGVVDDIRFESIATPVEPVAYILPPLSPVDFPRLSTASIRLSSQNLEETLAFIDETWSMINPGIPVTRSFLDDSFAALYRREENLGILFASFSLLAIVIACLGLFGLATSNAQYRTKEIGVRKVLGSSVMRIVLLLTNDFSKLVLVSNVIAWPIAYVAMSRWLENFAYRIDLTPLIFIGSGLIALCVAWVTVGGTAAKAASRKPVLALRYE